MNEKQIYQPSDKNLAKHIEYYWQVDNIDNLFKEVTTMYGYPGITPEIVIPLKGFFQYQYEGKIHRINHPIISTVVPKKSILSFEGLESFLVVRFKSSAVASLLPFVTHSSRDLVSQPLIDASEVFGNDISNLVQQLKISTKVQNTILLDEWFSKKMNTDREGFIVDVLQQNDICSIKELMSLTNYSYSTLERLFKKETGLTPKKYFVFKRFKSTLEEVIPSGNTDWFDYISKYGYYDQSHFIKEIKKYTQYTPLELLTIPSFVSYRPPSFHFFG